ncbi:MAG: hypothetical protein LBG11_05430 [Bifidobacteriaceae bacterium]|nr:hypothetical protein [Bifidobacteriaceae bacterium]
MAHPTGTPAPTQRNMQEPERVVHQTLNYELGKMFRGSRSKDISFKPGPAPIAPAPMVEPDDMVIVASPCHEYEPIKVPEAHLAHLYCLICGSEFAV